MRVVAHTCGTRSSRRQPPKTNAMKRWKLVIETSNLFKGTVVLPFEDENGANESLKEIQAQMKQGGGMYGILGVTTLDTREVTQLSVVDYDDGEDEDHS